MKPTKCLAKEQNEARKAKKKRGGEQVESKREDCCVIFKSKNYSKFCFLRMPKLRKLIFCIWIRRPQSVRPVNSFMVSFSSF